MKKRKEAEEVALFTRKLQQRTSVSPAAPDEPPTNHRSVKTLQLIKVTTSTHQELTENMNLLL